MSDLIEGKVFDCRGLVSDAVVRNGFGGVLTVSDAVARNGCDYGVVVRNAVRRNGFDWVTKR